MKIPSLVCVNSDRKFITDSSANTFNPSYIKFFCCSKFHFNCLKTLLLVINSFLCNILRLANADSVVRPKRTLAAAKKRVQWKAGSFARNIIKSHIKRASYCTVERKILVHFLVAFFYV